MYKCKYIFLLFKKYSCPLVPRQNYLRTKVRAGVKNFNKD
ncbi:hypothetical protein LDL77_03805 [Flagellimonas marinaquae]|nr:hypothetical protein LDL77_03805 [Allomuricauda aquimarina]